MTDDKLERATALNTAHRKMKAAIEVLQKWQPPAEAPQEAALAASQFRTVSIATLQKHIAANRVEFDAL